MRLAMRLEGRETHRSSGVYQGKDVFMVVQAIGAMRVFRSVLLTSLQLACPPLGLQTCKER